jgi:hypothetical protein
VVGVSKIPQNIVITHDVYCVAILG